VHMMKTSVTCTSNKQKEYTTDLAVGPYSTINHRLYIRSSSINIKIYATLLVTYKMGKKTNASKTYFSIKTCVFWNETPHSFTCRYQCCGGTCIFKIANMSHLIIILALANVRNSDLMYLDVTYNHNTSSVTAHIFLFCKFASRLLLPHQANSV
jgi:hypothetical protein